VDSCDAGTWSATNFQTLWNTALPYANTYASRTFFGYIGGENVTQCGLYVVPITAATEQRANTYIPNGATWGVGPIYNGVQAPLGCGGPSGEVLMGDTTAAALAAGKADADHARDEAKPQGWTSVIYDDMDYYTPTNLTYPDHNNCELIVTTFLNGWDNELQLDGYQEPAVYGTACSTIKGLVDYLGQPGMHEPAYVWPAQYVNESPWNVQCVPNGDWLDDQRSVQYCCQGGIYVQGLHVDTDCVLSGMEDGLAESVWDYGGTNDASDEVNSPTYDKFCRRT